MTYEAINNLLSGNKKEEQPIAKDNLYRVRESWDDASS